MYLVSSNDKVVVKPMPEIDATIERLQEFSEVDAEQIGRLMPFLSTAFTNEPIKREVLEAIISSPYHEQIVARFDGVIVGAATMNLLLGPGLGKEGYLEDFVTHPVIRRCGVGHKIWQEVLTWCHEQGISLSFTSHSTRESAHQFYIEHEAEVYDTTVFRKHVP